MLYLLLAVVVVGEVAVIFVLLRLGRALSEYQASTNLLIASVIEALGEIARIRAGDRRLPGDKRSPHAP